MVPATLNPARSLLGAPTACKSFLITIGSSCVSSAKVVEETNSRP